MHILLKFPTTHCSSTSGIVLRDSDGVPHFVQDNVFESALVLQHGDVGHDKDTIAPTKRTVLHEFQTLVGPTEPRTSA